MGTRYAWARFSSFYNLFEVLEMICYFWFCMARKGRYLAPFYLTFNETPENKNFRMTLYVKLHVEYSFADNFETPVAEKKKSLRMFQMDVMTKKKTPRPLPFHPSGAHVTEVVKTAMHLGRWTYRLGIISLKAESSIPLCQISLLNLAQSKNKRRNLVICILF